jgi:hypothetical protein
VSLTVHDEGRQVFRLDVSGMLRRAELDEAEGTIARAIDAAGDVRLLVVLTAFEGWSSDDDWSGLQFYMEHGDRIARIAIVGDEQWRSHMLLFAAADLRRAPVQYFAGDAVEEARDWLGE